MFSGINGCRFRSSARHALNKNLQALACVVTGLIFLTLGSVAWADGFTVEVGVTPSTGYNGVNSQTPLDTGMLAQTSVTIDPTTVTYSPEGYSGTATAGGTAALGSLTGAVSASTTTFDDINVPGGSDAVYVGVWTDTLTVDSSTLALGAPVELLFTLNVDIASTCTGSGIVSGGAVFNVNGGDEQLVSSDPTCNSTLKQSVPLDVMTSVGSSIGVQGLLTLNASAGPSCTGCSNVLGTASMDPSAGFFIDSETAGASYATASGQTYFTPTGSPMPEPSSLGLLGLGLLGLIGIHNVRRSDSSATRSARMV